MSLQSLFHTTHTIDHLFNTERDFRINSSSLHPNLGTEGYDLPKVTK